MNKIIVLILLIIIPITAYSANIIKLVDKYSKRYSVDDRIVNGIIEAESAGESHAVSHKGAVGKMGITIIVWDQYYTERYKKEKRKIFLYFLKIPNKLKRSYLKNDERNIRIGCYYLRWCLDRTKNDNYIQALQFYLHGTRYKQVGFDYIYKIINKVVNFK
jgi:soluble lytic murein transglycosylase-like protein